MSQADKKQIWFYWRTKAGEDKALAFPGAQSVQITRTAKATRKKVEGSIDVTDDVRPEPIEVEIGQAVISNTPMNADTFGVGTVETIELNAKIYNPGPTNLSDLISTGFTALAAAANVDVPGTQKIQKSVAVLSFDQEFDFVARQIQDLDTARKEGAAITAVLPHEVIDNLVIESIVEDSKRAHAVLDIKLAEINIVSTELVNAPKPTVKRATPKSDKGAQGSKDAAAPPRDSALSYLSNSGKRVQ